MKIIWQNNSSIWKLGITVKGIDETDRMILENNKTVPSELENMISANSNRYSCEKKRYEWFENLLNKKEEILELIGDDRDVLVLGDDRAESLCIYKALKKFYEEKKFSLHLYAMMPPRFFFRERTEMEVLLKDISDTKSLLLYDGEIEWRRFLPNRKGKRKKVTFGEFMNYFGEKFAEKLPEAIEGIQKMKEGRYYFYDFCQCSYMDTELKEGYWHNDNKSYLYMGYVTENIILKKNKPDRSVQNGEVRVDGKELCQKLRKLRIQFARMNGIPYNAADCNYYGACAGTCEKCDDELEYLMSCMEEKKKIVYPRRSLKELTQKERRKERKELFSKQKEFQMAEIGLEFMSGEVEKILKGESKEIK